MLLPMLAKHYRKESRTTKHIPGDERTIQRFGSQTQCSNQEKPRIAVLTRTRFEAFYIGSSRFLREKPAKKGLQKEHR